MQETFVFMERLPAFLVNYQREAYFFGARFQHIETLLQDPALTKSSITAILLMLEPLLMKVYNDGSGNLPICISRLQDLWKVIL